MLSAVNSVLASPEGVARANEAYALLDALAEASVDDPRVDDAARKLADSTPRELLPEAVSLDHGSSFLRAFYADFAPAQAEAIRRAMRILTEET